MSRDTVDKASGQFRLKLRKLDFVSAVDQPAQETATVCLIKRKASDNLAATARVVKLADELGLVFGWAFTSTIDGEPYFDLQGDAIDQDFIKAAAAFMECGGATDEMHDGERDGRVVFCMPMTADVAKAFGVETETVGLMVAIKPSPPVFAKFKSGEYTGFSIAGYGDREAVKAKPKCPECSGYVAKDDAYCAKCGMAMPSAKSVAKADWPTAYVDNLPDSAFLYVEGGGKKDDDGKTTPRSLRHFPYKDVNNKIDVAHLRDATGRIPQSSLPADLKEKLQQKAEKILAAQHAEKSASRVLKHAYLTTAVAGHTHLLDHDNGQAAGYTEYASLDVSDGSGFHCHPWVRNTDADTFVIGEASGHTHEVIPQDQIDSIVDSGDGDVDEDDAVKSAKGPVMPAKDELTELKTKLEKRDAEIARLGKKYSMTDSQRAHYRTLEKQHKDAFLDKSHAERDADVAKAIEADPVVVTLDGVDYRKSAGEATLAIVKRAKDTAEQLAKRDAELETERLTKRAGAELGNLPGEAKGKIALLKALDAIPAEDDRKVAKAIVAAGNGALAPMFKGIGHAGNASEATSAKDELDVLTKQYAEKNGVPETVAMGAVLKTADGKRLYAAMEAAKRN